jgi:hypothetical protein
MSKYFEGVFEVVFIAAGLSFLSAISFSVSLTSNPNNVAFVGTKYYLLTDEFFFRSYF